MGKQYRQYLKYLIIGILLFIPNVCFGLAGLGEIDYDCYYTPNILVYFGDPSDMCRKIDNKSQTCLIVHYPASGSFNFKSFELDPLTEINIPENNNPKFIMGKSYFDNNWQIYDVASNKIVFNDIKYDNILNEWRKLGNPDPKFASINNFLDHFKQTEESKKNNKEREGFGMALIISFLAVYLGPVIVVFLFVIIFSFVQKKLKAKKNK